MCVCVCVCVCVCACVYVCVCVRGETKFSADKKILHLVGWVMKEMLEANLPIHFLTSCKSVMPAAPRQETASVQGELENQCYGATIVY